MFENKLTALDFHSPDNFEYLDDKVFRNFVSWIENQKIRLYTIEDREALDQVDDPNWTNAFTKYLKDLDLRNLTANSDRETQIEKLLSHAISLEFADNTDFYNSKTKELLEETEVCPQQDDLFEKIDYTSAEFKEGLERLRKLLGVPTKENDHTSVLQAVSLLLEQTVNSQAEPKTKESNSIQLALDDIDSGFDTNDKNLNDASKILRLLYIKDLRDLQTQINETIVSVQNITANPKTDSSLGKVGR